MLTNPSNSWQFPTIIGNCGRFVGNFRRFVGNFRRLLAISDGGEVTFGSPFINGAKVLAQVQSHYKDKKLIVFKYKRKTRYRRKKSHRQTYTRVVIQDVMIEGEGKPAPRRASRPRARRATPAAAAQAESGEKA